MTTLVLGIIASRVIIYLSYFIPYTLISSWKQEAIESLKIPPESVSYDDICMNCLAENKTIFSIHTLSLLKGRKHCSLCQQKLSYGPIMAELLTLCCAIGCFYHYGLTITGGSYFLFCCFLIVATIVDWETMLLPDEITWPLLMIGVLLSILNITIGLYDCMQGVLLGYYMLWLLYWIHRIISGQEGLGFGDFKLTAAIGSWLGWAAIIPLIAFSAGLAVISFCIRYMVSAEKSWKNPMPFGPYLSIGAILFLLFLPRYDFWLLY